MTGCECDPSRYNDQDDNKFSLSTNIVTDVCVSYLLRQVEKSPEIEVIAVAAYPQTPQFRPSSGHC
jgi:hypothetical protein